MEYEMTLAEQIEWQDRQYPVCDDCYERIGLGCACRREDDEVTQEMPRLTMAQIVGVAS
jgi:hypothetical protein